MAGTDRRKRNVLFPEEMWNEIRREAIRQDRSLSWILQKAWKGARAEILTYASGKERSREEANASVSGLQGGSLSPPARPPAT